MARKFLPVEYPDGPALRSLMKAAAVNRLLQCYLTSDRYEEAPMLPHLMDWVCESISDNILRAQESIEREADARLRAVREASND